VSADTCRACGAAYWLAYETRMRAGGDYIACTRAALEAAGRGRDGTAMSLPEMEAIVRRHATVGDYRGADFRVSPAVRAELAAAFPAKPDPDPWAVGVVAGLLGLSVAVDESLPEGEWRLVDSATGEILYRSTL
jgi:hypothetical protein